MDQEDRGVHIDQDTTTGTTISQVPRLVHVILPSRVCVRSPVHRVHIKTNHKQYKYLNKQTDAKIVWLVNTVLLDHHNVGMMQRVVLQERIQVKQQLFVILVQLQSTMMKLED